jgi:hypothetical protein
MAKKSLSGHQVFFTQEEYRHCRRALQTISNRAGNLQRIFEAVGKRSADEFKTSMRIIRKGGAE